MDTKKTQTNRGWTQIYADGAGSGTEVDLVDLVDFVDFVDFVDLEESVAPGNALSA